MVQDPACGYVGYANAAMTISNLTEYSEKLLEQVPVAPRSEYDIQVLALGRCEVAGIQIWLWFVEPAVGQETATLCSGSQSPRGSVEKGLDGLPKCRKSIASYRASRIPKPFRGVAEYR